MTREEIIKGLENYIPWADEYEVDIEVLTGALALLKQEPCEDAISRQAVLEIQAKYAEHIGATKFWQMRDDIKALPSVTPQEPKAGHWISGICDNCGYDWGKDAPIASVPNFCPNCGCRMVEPQESEDKE